MPIFWCLVDPPKTCSFVGLIKRCHLLTALFWDAVESFVGLFDVFYYILTGESTSKADKFDNFCRRAQKALGSALRDMYWNKPSKQKGVNLEGLGGWTFIDFFNLRVFIRSNAGRTTNFAPVKSLRFFELFPELSLFEFRFAVFFPLGVEWIHESPPLQCFQTAKGKKPKEAWGGHLSGKGINVTFLQPHEPQVSATTLERTSSGRGDCTFLCKTVYTHTHTPCCRRWHIWGLAHNWCWRETYHWALREMCCVTLNQIDPSYMICIPSSIVLCPHYSTLSSPLPIRYDKISRKGQVFRSFVLFGLMRNLFEV